MDNSVRWELFFDDKTKAGIESTKEGMKTLEQELIKQQQLIEALETQLTELHMQMALGGDVTMVDPSNLAMVDALKDKIRELSVELEGYQQRAKMPTSQGDAVIDGTKKKFDGLRWQVNQFARELPALAMGPQMFFLAISNNLPMLTDEIKKAKEEYKDLLSQGQKGTPVWKQLLSSMFSWQTALVVGITLLVTYGKEIGTFIGGLFGAKKALDENVESLEGFRKKVGDSTGKSVASFKSLAAQWESLGDDMEAKERFIRSNAEAFRELGEDIRSVGDAERMFANGGADFVASLTKRAMAAAAVELAAEKYKEAMIKQMEHDPMPDKITEKRYYKKAVIKGKETILESGDDRFSSYNGLTYSKEVKLGKENPAKVKLKAEIDELNGQADKYIESSRNFAAEVKKTTSEVTTGGGEIVDEIIKGSIADLDKQIATLKSEQSKLSTNDTIYVDYEAKIKAIELQRNAIVKAQEKLPENNINKFKEDAQRRVNENVFALMVEGAEKQKALLKKKHDEEIAEIDKNERELLAGYVRLKRAGVAVSEGEVNGVREHYSKAREQEREKLDIGVKSIDDKTTADADKISADKQEKERKILNDTLLEFETYSQKRLRIAAEYDAKIKLLTDNGERGGAAEAEGAKRLALEGIDQAFASKQLQYTAWADTLTNMSLTQLNTMLVDAKAKLDEMELGGASDSEMAAARAKVAKAQKELDELRAKQNVQGELSPQKRTLKDWAALQDVLRDVKSDFDDIGDAVGGTTGEIIKSAGEITASTIMMIDGILKLADTSVEATKKTAETASKAVQAVEKASVILAIISAAMQIVSKIGEALNKVKEVPQELIDVYQRWEGVVGDVVKRQKELLKTLSGSEVTKATKETEELIKKQIAAAQMMGKITLDSGSGFFKASIGKDLKKQLKPFYHELAAVGLDINKMGDRMTGLFDLSAEELLKFKEASPLAWAKIGKDVTDYLDKVIEGQTTLEELKAIGQEVSTGMSFDTLSDGLADFLNDADATFADVAKSFEDHMKKAVNDVIAKDLNTDLKKWYADFAAAMASGRGLTEQEKKRLQADYDKIHKEAKERQEAAYDVAGIDRTPSITQTGGIGVVTSMTQDQAGKLEGLFTASEMRFASIDVTTQEVKRSMDSVGVVLVKIEENTSATNGKLDSIDKTLSDIKTNGITMK